MERKRWDDEAERCFEAYFSLSDSSIEKACLRTRSNKSCVGGLYFHFFAGTSIWGRGSACQSGRGRKMRVTLIVQACHRFFRKFLCDLVYVFEGPKF